jgi:hypothetical protein
MRDPLPPSALLLFLLYTPWKMDGLLMLSQPSPWGGRDSQAMCDSVTPPTLCALCPLTVKQQNMSSHLTDGETEAQGRNTHTGQHTASCHRAQTSNSKGLASNLLFLSLHPPHLSVDPPVTSSLSVHSLVT